MSLNDYEPIEQETKIGKVVISIIGVLAVIGIIVLVIWIINLGLKYKNQQDKIASEIKSFDGRIDEYLIPDSQLVGTPDNNLYVNGKIIVINTNEKTIDSIQYELPDELRATKPDEVGTIVWLDWGKTFVVRYTNGANGYAHSIRVTIIDKTKKTIIHSMQITGSNPPSNTDERGDVYGAKPINKILAHIKGVQQGTISYVQNEPPPLSTTIRNDIRKLIFIVIVILVIGIAGWLGTRKWKKILEKRLGRKVYSEHELTSISVWMKGSSENIDAENKK